MAIARSALCGASEHLMFVAKNELLREKLAKGICASRTYIEMQEEMWYIFGFMYLFSVGCCQNDE